MHMRGAITRGAVVLVAAVAACFFAAPARAAYPADVQTQCTSSLSHFVGTSGETNTAALRVASGAGTPTGRAAISIDGHRTRLVPLRNGVASRVLPTTLKAGSTYVIRLRYLPTPGSTYKACVGGARTYTVLRPSAANPLPRPAPAPTTAMTTAAELAPLVAEDLSMAAFRTPSLTLLFNDSVTSVIRPIFLNVSYLIHQ